MRSVLPRSRRQALGALTTLAGAGFGLIVLLGFFGDLSPALDSIAQLRAHAALALGIVGLALLIERRASASLAALATAALGLYSVLPFMLPARPSPDAVPGTPRYTLLQMNLRFDAPDPTPALSLIARLEPDVVAAQELTPEWNAALRRLSPAYPYQYYCGPNSRSIGDVAILSRRPFVEAAPALQGEGTVCDRNNDFAAKTVDFNGLPVMVASQHLRWPWPFPQPQMVEALSPTLAGLSDPLIVAGDFNAAPWSASLRRYARESRTRILAGVGATWLTARLPTRLARYVGLPIDNVLVSGGVEVLDVETLAPTSSDHLPVLVTFTMRFAVPDEPDVRSAAR